MITLLQLEYFRKLAASEHITRTAKELYISQTALSSMIIGLEKELGVQLFDRSRRAIHLNEAGRVYLQYVNEIFAALENGQAALKDLEETREKNVSLAVGSSLVWLPMFHAFQKSNPGVIMQQFNLDTDNLNLALQEMTVDYVIAGEDDITVPGLERCLIKVDGVYAVVAPDHKLAGRESIRLDELAREPLIGMSGGSPWRGFCDHLFERAGLKANIVVECDYTMRAPLIESGFGIALTSSTAKQVDLLKPNKYIRISDEGLLRPMYLYWNPKKYISKAALHFKEYCVEYYRNSPI